MAHETFTEQPVSADVYMFRFVFYDWSDAYVVKILRQLIPALKPGARIIISDSNLPERNTLLELYERKIRRESLTSIIRAAIAESTTVLSRCSCYHSSIPVNAREMIGNASARSRFAVQIC